MDGGRFDKHFQTWQDARPPREGRRENLLIEANRTWVACTFGQIRLSFSDEIRLRKIDTPVT
jgi:hypothetical protein